MKFDFFCIVEGHGETKAFSEVVGRIQRQVRQDLYLNFIPYRAPRTKILAIDELDKIIELANRKIQAPGAILIAVDADDDLPCRLGPQLLESASKKHRRPEIPLGVVVANREFEAWFLAAYESIGGQHGLAVTLPEHISPEGVRDAKGTLRRQMKRGNNYSPAVDQVKFARIFDMSIARDRSPSFDKCCREVERLLMYGQP